jgi:hypothetical protein
MLGVTSKSDGRSFFRDADREDVNIVATRLSLAVWHRNLATIPSNRGRMVHPPGLAVVFEIQRVFVNRKVGHLMDEN